MADDKKAGKGSGREWAGQTLKSLEVSDAELEAAALAARKVKVHVTVAKDEQPAARARRLAAIEEAKAQLPDYNRDWKAEPSKKEPRPVADDDDQLADEDSAEDDGAEHDGGDDIEIVRGQPMAATDDPKATAALNLIIVAVVLAIVALLAFRLLR